IRIFLSSSLVHRRSFHQLRSRTASAIAQPKAASSQWTCPSARLNIDDTAVMNAKIGPAPALTRLYPWRSRPISRLGQTSHSLRACAPSLTSTARRPPSTCARRATANRNVTAQLCARALVLLHLGQELAGPDLGAQADQVDGV